MRKAGLLLPIFALPGKEGIGTFGASARTWIDRLAEVGHRVWQILPLHPPGYGASPYSSSSTFGGYLGLLDVDDFCDRFEVEKNLVYTGDLSRVDYAWVREKKLPWLYGWAQRLKNCYDYSDFVQEHQDWLEPFACFQAHKRLFRGKPWWQWKEATVDPDWIEQEYFLQWVWFSQWEDLRYHARTQGVAILGDLPLFLAHDSDDVWAQPELFKIRDGALLQVAGVPPDYFSQDGQRWGNPVYDWEVHEATDFAWWIRRIAHAYKLFDKVRLDHFRGLQATWEIPAESPTARGGSWVDVPGRELLKTLEQADLVSGLIAEDLGVITPEVEALRDDFGLPGMAVLQFAFSGDPDNPHPNHHQRVEQVVYTGTHDNTTLSGWWRGLSRDEKQHVRRYCGLKTGSGVSAVRALAYASVAQLSVVPIQDWLLEPGSSRWNTPGKAGQNWSWRMSKEAWGQSCWGAMGMQAQITNRCISCEA